MYLHVYTYTLEGQTFERKPSMPARTTLKTEQEHNEDMYICIYIYRHICLYINIYPFINIQGHTLERKPSMPARTTLNRKRKDRGTQCGYIHIYLYTFIYIYKSIQGHTLERKPSMAARTTLKKSTDAKRIYTNIFAYIYTQMYILWLYLNA